MNINYTENVFFFLLTYRQYLRPPYNKCRQCRVSDWCLTPCDHFVLPSHGENNLQFTLDNNMISVVHAFMSLFPLYRDYNEIPNTN
jgi:hypothetical protein